VPRAFARTVFWGGLAIVTAAILTSVPVDLAGHTGTGLAGIKAAPETLIAAPGAVSVIDGDTLRLAGLVVRLRGVQAPRRQDRCQAGDCGTEATLALAAIVRDRQVQCVTQSRDDQGRPVVDCDANGMDVALAMSTHVWTSDWVPAAR